MKMDLAETGYRAVRVVTDPTHSPWTPATIAHADGGVMLIDEAQLPEAWPGWRVDGDGHVLAARDVVRHASGHQVVVSLCVERVPDLIARRRQEPFTDGERVTFAVSVLRGLSELTHPERDSLAQWWLTEAGKPVLVFGDGTRMADEASIDALESLTEHAGAITELLREAIEGVRARGPTRILTELEERLFAAAPSEPLATAILRVREVAGPELTAEDADVDAGSRPSGWPAALASVTNTDMADVISRVTTSVWRGVRQSRPRRAPWLVAGAVAVIVVMAGVFWPGEQHTSAAPFPTTTGAATPMPSATGATETSTTATPAAVPSPMTPSATPSASASPATPDGDGDVIVRATQLLAQYRECATASEQSCLATVLESASHTPEPGAIDAEDPTITLLDDLGGLIVLRVEATDLRTQMLTLVRIADQWRIRDAVSVPGA